MTHKKERKVLEELKKSVDYQWANENMTVANKTSDAIQVALKCMEENAMLADLQAKLCRMRQVLEKIIDIGDTEDGVCRRIAQEALNRIDKEADSDKDTDSVNVD